MTAGLAFDKRRQPGRLLSRYRSLRASRGREKSSDCPMKPTAASGPFSTIRGCVSPTISTSHPTVASSSAKRRYATTWHDWMTEATRKPRQRPDHLLRSAEQDVAHGIPHLMFPNGICVTFDGQSILFAETFACRISRYWFDGPKAGTVEPVISDLPGLPDNINRASDGNYLVRHRRMRRVRSTWRCGCRISGAA